MTPSSPGRPGFGAIVGRVGERQQLARALSDVTSGGCRLLLVSGDPGIGKTRMLAELADLAGRGGALVLTGRAAEFERDLPFGLFLDALDDELQSSGKAVLDQLPLQQRQLLGTVFPAAAQGGGLTEPAADIALALLPRAAGAETSIERFRVHRAVRTVLERLAGDRLLVLILDDCHWADDASVELLDHLLRHPPRCRALFAVGLRPRQASARLTASLYSAEASMRMELVELEPLSRAETAQLLGMRIAEIDELYASSGGNPFYAQALHRVGSTDARPLALPLDGAGGVPTAVAGALRSEIIRLPEQTRQVALAAAVAGESCSLQQAIDISGLDEPRTVRALEELERNDLIRMRESGQFAFRHPLVRAAAYLGVSEQARVEAHRRAAAAAERRGWQVVERAHHIERSAQPGDHAAIAALTEAAAQVLDRAPAIAADWAASALRLLSETPIDSDQPERRLELLTHRATALFMSGQLIDSRAILHQLRRELPVDPPVKRVAVAVACARVERLLGLYDEAYAMMRDTLSSLQPGHPDEEASLTCEIAMLCLLRSEVGQAREWAVRGLELATGTTLAARLHAAAAAGVLASSSTILADIHHAAEILPTAVASIDAATDEELALRLGAITGVVRAELALERFDDAIRHSERALTIARRTGQRQLVPNLLVDKSEAHYWRGQLDEAFSCAEDAAEMAHLLKVSELQVAASTALCRAAVIRGQLDAAIDAASWSVKTSRAPDPYYAREAQVQAGYAHIIAGQQERGIQEILAAVGEEQQHLPASYRPWIFELLAFAEVGRGRLDEARKWADRAVEAAPAGLRRGAAFAAMAHAHIRLAAGESAEAAELARSAAQDFGAVKMQISVGRAQLLAGEALARSGDREGALAALGIAKDLFARGGAQQVLAEVVDSQRRIGARMRRAGAPSNAGLDSLTTREREIASLIARGLSNKQVAERIFVSPKTVESHLSRIYAKLGVTSRTALALTIGPRDD
ncbi:helix-turn-helix transcriptional regulator [Fodinicola acaciae]|uniref:helix-turn-helix transcriptional regulator n=1 Tax=Fodinicola acaciae TaxID=2681555 RepID=UPI0013D4CA17|nr:LuxR family transcriptional regulator [Fodinicola acaciae]